MIIIIIIIMEHSSPLLSKHPQTPKQIVGIESRDNLEFFAHVTRCDQV